MPTKYGWVLAIFVVLLLILPLVAIATHGRDGLRGITWGFGDTGETTDKPRPQHAVNFGVYDPERVFAESRSMAIEHFVIQWNTYKKSEIEPQLEYAASRNRWPLITVEPFPYDRSDVARRNLFMDILGGKYDGAIVTICTDLKRYGDPVFVRWGHEMENVTGRYPWAQAHSSGYIASYRHFVEKCRPIADNALYVWSPVGQENLGPYWPGEEYVDWIGLSVFGFPGWDVDYFGKVRSFEEIFQERYDRVRHLNISVMIAELGVTGGEDHQQRWMDEALGTFHKYPLLKTVVYFNSSDSPLAWGPDYPVPDWRIDPDYFAFDCRSSSRWASCDE